MTSTSQKHRPVSEIERDITSLTTLSAQKRMLGGLSDEELVKYGRLLSEKQKAERHYAEQERSNAAGDRAAKRKRAFALISQSPRGFGEFSEQLREARAIFSELIPE
jgi:hypothetical protein